MPTSDDPGAQEFLKVLLDRSELQLADKEMTVFREGPQSVQAKARYAKIKTAFEEGFLEELVTSAKEHPTVAGELAPEITSVIEGLVAAVSSERGRALVGLTVLQLCIKAICASQSIRLHKGDSRHGDDRFSWCEGISMRSLDKNYVTPVLRKHDLIRLNADGFMMTRSLAENYPYSKFYKAALRGGRNQWLMLTDLIETETLDPLAALKLLIALLLNRRQAFSEMADRTLALLSAKLRQIYLTRVAMSHPQRSGI
jgi:hypothetical protein